MRTVCVPTLSPRTVIGVRPRQAPSTRTPARVGVDRMTSWPVAATAGAGRPRGVAGAALAAGGVWPVAAGAEVCGPDGGGPAGAGRGDSPLASVAGAAASGPDGVDGAVSP